MVRISSTANARIKAAAALTRRKERERQRRYLVEGPRAVSDLLGLGAIEEVFATDEGATALHAEPGDLLTLVSDEVLTRLADSVTPQGVVAVARQVRAGLGDVLGAGFALVLCAIADPGNAGTIVRTATAAGAAGVVFTTGSVDPWNPKAVRASAGAVARIGLVVDVEPAAVLAACRERGQRTVGLDAQADATVDDPGRLAAPVALFLGNEAHGLPDEVLHALDDLVAVPRYGPVESLNLAAAAAVASYAVARTMGREGSPAGGGA